MVRGRIAVADVDDLTEGFGADSVDKSQYCLVFVSEGYFASKNASISDSNR